MQSPIVSRTRRRSRRVEVSSHARRRSSLRTGRRQSLRAVQKHYGQCLSCTSTVKELGVELGTTLMKQNVLAICKGCHDLGIIGTQPEIDQALARVLKALRYLGMDPRHPLEERPLPVKATPITEINATSQLIQAQLKEGVNTDDRRQLLGRTDVVALRSRTKRSPMIRNIHVASKLPWFIFESTLAHELTHTYIWIHRTSEELPALTTDIEEQICDAVAIWYLRRILSKERKLSSEEIRLINRRLQLLCNRWRTPFMDSLLASIESQGKIWTAAWLDKFIKRGDVTLVRLSQWSVSKQRLVLDAVEQGDRRRSLVSKLSPSERISGRY